MDKNHINADLAEVCNHDWVRGAGHAIGDVCHRHGLELLHDPEGLIVHTQEGRATDAPEYHETHVMCADMRHMLVLTWCLRGRLAPYRAWAKLITLCDVQN